LFKEVFGSKRKEITRGKKQLIMISLIMCLLHQILLEQTAAKPGYHSQYNDCLQTTDRDAVPGNIMHFSLCHPAQNGSGHPGGESKYIGGVNVITCLSLAL
jgi:hypothetical protein